MERRPAATCPRRSWKGWLVLLGFLAVAGYLLAGEHRVHVLSAAPFLIFFACPLMHLFMHGGQGARGSAGSADR